MTEFPDAALWREACAADAVLGTWAGPWTENSRRFAEHLLPILDELKG